MTLFTVQFERVHGVQGLRWTVRDSFGGLKGVFLARAEADLHVAFLTGPATPATPVPPPAVVATPLSPPPPPIPLAPTVPAQGVVPAYTPIPAYAPPPPPTAQHPAPGPLPPPVPPPPVRAAPLPPSPPPPAPPPNPYAGPAFAAFPQGMQNARFPLPPQRPRRPQPFGRRFGAHFGASYARMAKYGYGSARHAARSAFVASAPKAALGLAIANEAKDTILGAVRALKDFTDEMLQANRALARYSPLLAVEFARLQLGDYQRNLGLGKYTGETGADLVKAVNAMRDSFFPYQVFGRNLANQGAEAGADLMGKVAEEFRHIPELLEFFRQNFGGGIEGVAGHFVDAFMVAINQAMPQFALLFGGLDALNKGLKALKDALGVQPLKPGVGLGAWDTLIMGQAAQGGRGPLRMTPLHGNKPFNPADRRP